MAISGCTPTHSPKFKNPKQYLEAKLELFSDQFCITPTAEQIVHMQGLKTQDAIDNAFISIMDAFYNK